MERLPMTNIPSPEEMVARIREAERASLLVHDNYETYRHRYPDQHIALHNEEVVATASDAWELVDKIEAAGLDLADVWTFYIPAEPMQLLL